MPKPHYELPNGPVFIWRLAADCQNAFFARKWLASTDEANDFADHARFSKIVHPDDLGRSATDFEIACDAHIPFAIEYRLLDASGNYKWFQDNGVPTFEADGKYAGYYGSCIDIDEKKSLETEKELLSQEFAHRLKNTLASIQALASLTFRTSSSMEDAKVKLISRVLAISRVHDLIIAGGGDRADFATLVDKMISRHVSADTMVKVEGPEFFVSAKQCATLAIVFDELCTNSMRFGALAKPRGSIGITWTIVQRDGEPFVHLQWIERGGPVVHPPRVKGFGSRLLLQMSPASLEGEARWSFDPEGISCEMTFPLFSAVRH